MRGYERLRLVFVCTVVFMVAIYSTNGFAAAEICGELGNYRYLKIKDNGPGKRIRGYACIVIKDSSELQGVLTLKHLSNQGNWDVLVGTHFDASSKKMYGTIDYKNNSGNVDELVWLPGNSSKEHIVVVYPTSNKPSEACLIFHRFDAGELMGQALIMATAQSVLVELFSDKNDTQESRNNKSRVIAGGLSILNRNNVALFGYDMVLNEISTQLADAFGGGSWMFIFGVR